MDCLSVMTSIFLYGTVYDIHDFIHHHKRQFMSSMFFYGGQPREQLSTNAREILCSSRQGDYQKFAHLLPEIILQPIVSNRKKSAAE